MLAKEYQNIFVTNEEPVNKNKKVKLRKKTIVMTDDYYENTMKT